MRVRPPCPMILFGEVMGTGQGLPWVQSWQPGVASARHVVSACHVLITVLSQVQKLRQKHQEDKGLPPKDTEDLWGEFSLLPHISAPPQNWPFHSVQLIAQHQFHVGPCEGYKDQKDAIFP